MYIPKLLYRRARIGVILRIADAFYTDGSDIRYARSSELDALEPVNAPYVIDPKGGTAGSWQFDWLRQSDIPFRIRYDERPDWLPYWVVYAAMDADGEVCLYRQLPEFNGVWWRAVSHYVETTFDYPMSSANELVVFL